jgi:hypothetical protein
MHQYLSRGDGVLFVEPFGSELMNRRWVSTVLMLFLSKAQQSLVGQGLLSLEASRSHSGTPHSVGLPRTRDQPDVETSNCQHNTHNRQISMPP